MAPGDNRIGREQIAADLARAGMEFDGLLAEAERHNAWAKPTRGTRWTTEQLLFHMVFGYMVVQRLHLLVRVFSRLPDAASRMFARVLNAATRPFDVINYYGSCAAALIYNRRRMGPKMARVIAALQRQLARDCDDALRGGMHFPTRWDPFFQDYMTLGDVYCYPGQHLAFHARQLSFTATE
jgi:hypothetical protein